MPMLIAKAATEGGLSFVDAVRLATVQPELLIFDGAIMRTRLPGDTACLIELTWKPAEAKLQIHRIVMNIFSDPLSQPEIT